MDKCWYCIVEGGAKGPYTKEDLLLKPFFTPESLVWKEGFSDWKPAKDVDGFFDQDDSEEDTRPDFKDLNDEDGVDSEGEVALLEEKEPPNFILWLLILLVILVFYLYQTFSR